MRLFTLGALLSALVLLVDAQEVIKPKVVVLSTFVTEQDAWRGAQGFNTFASNVTIGGMMGESVHCSVDGGVCQAVVGEGGMSFISYFLLNVSVYLFLALLDHSKDSQLTIF